MSNSGNSHLTGRRRSQRTYSASRSRPSRIRKAPFCRRSKVSVPRKRSPSELHSLVTRADALEKATVRTRHSEAKNSICHDEMWTRPSLLRSWQAAISAPHVPCIRAGKPFDPAWAIRGHAQTGDARKEHNSQHSRGHSPIGGSELSKAA